MSNIKCLNTNLWSEDDVGAKKRECQSSEPYKHLVVRDLVDDHILGKVKDELQRCIIATLKETDIYKVYQTGDLANLSGLGHEEKSQLSNLSTLRDALYSLEFRKLVSRWTRVGPLSSSCIDLSVNAYGHTGHLLCHDDVIGSRRVSYILYLVDDDWNSGEKEDGGALQLYPLANPDVPGTPALIPSKSIPPKWNQLALFAVDPGRSFHDVQEVYNEAAPRLAISGWFHRAKESELDEWTKEEISEGVEHDQFFDSKQSSLAQLEGDPFHNEAAPSELPCASSQLRPFQEPTTVISSEQLSNWINKEYLSNATTEQCAKAFVDNGSNIQLHKFFRVEAAEKILLAIKAADKRDKLGYQESTPFDVGVGYGWEPVGPPHRQRFLRLSELTNVNDDDDDGAAKVLRQVCEVLSSQAFMMLLQHITGLTLISQRTQSRRFRPDDDKEYKEAAWTQDEVGGYQTYVDANEEEHSGEGDSKSEGQGGNDPAVYDAGDNGPLLSVSAANNALSLVLRDDAGVISFVKYVSSAAPGSRFDVVGEYSVDASEEEENGTAEGVNGGKGDIEGTSRRPTENQHDDDSIPNSSAQATKKTRHNE